jgi:uncharacterized protein (TIGR03083 family)
MSGRRIDRPEARVLAEEEFRRFAALCGSFMDDEWLMPTDCVGWTVRDVALHVLGSADAQASVKEFLHQFVRGIPVNRQIESHHWVDGINELQIRERRTLSNDELVAQLVAVGPNAVAGRWRTPAPVRHLPLPIGPPVGWTGLWYLLDVGFTRDVWAHRIDLCEATGRPMEPTPEHDGRLVADLVGEWATVYGHSFELVLDGPAGGTFSQGVGGEHVEMDAIQFVRTLCGRRSGAGVLTHEFPL